MKNNERRLLQRIKDAPIIDNIFMIVFFDGNKKAAKLLLRIILNMPNVEVREVETEKHLKNLHGHDVKLDIHAEDSAGNRFDVEIQRDNRGASPRRARYHSAMLDSHMLNKGQNYDDLKDSYVIFITENDYLKRKLPLYKIDRRFSDNNEQFEDGEHIIYVNGADKNSQTELGRLMHDLSCSDPEQMYFKELAERTRELKQTTRGIKKMTKYYDKWDREVAEEKSLEIAMNLITDGTLSYDAIAKATGLSIEKVTELARAKAV